MRALIFAAVRSISRQRGACLLAATSVFVGAVSALSASSLLVEATRTALPIAFEEQLARVYEVSQDEELSYGVSETAYERWTHQLRSPAEIRAFVRRPSPTVVQFSDGPRFIERGRLEVGLLDLLGVKPLAGRLFVPSSDPSEIIIGERLWRRQFNAAPGIVGHPLRTDGDGVFTIVGVVPDGVGVVPESDAWSIWKPPARPADDRLRLGVVAKLRSSTGLKDLRQELWSLGAAGGTHRAASAVALRDALLGRRKQALQVGAGAAFFLLALALLGAVQIFATCTAARDQNHRLHLALGCPRWRVLATEAAGVVLVTGLACACAAASSRVVLASIGIVSMPFMPVSRQPGVVFLVWCSAAIVLTVVTAHAIVTAPGIVWSRRPVPGARTVTRRQNSWMVLPLEVFIASVLASAAVVLGTALYKKWAIDPGVRTTGVSSLTVQLPLFRQGETWRHYPLPRFARDADALWKRVEAQLPGVRAAVTSDLPIAGASDPDARIALNPESTFAPVHPTTPWKPDAPQQAAYVHRVSSGYLDVLHISLLAGRNLRPDDAVSPQLLDDWDAARGEGVALVNRAFAMRAFAGAAAALGQRISVQEDFVPARVIVGVVADTHLNRQDSGSAPHVYVPFADGPAERFALVACCADLPAVVLAAAPLPGDPFAVRDPTTLTELLRTPFAVERAVTGVIAALAVTALIICAIAIYAVGSAHVRRRERELGIRVALGARHRSLQYDLARATVVQSIGAAVMGVVFSQLILRPFGYASRGFDLVAVAAATVALVCLMLAAATAPAWRRIARVDPVVLLRSPEA